MIKRLVFLLAALAAASTSPLSLAAEDYVRADQLDRYFRDYLLEHPEVVVESIQRWQAEQQRAQAQQAKQAVQARRDEIFNDPSAPIGGNPSGDVTVVEFMDYNCGFCRKVFPDITRLIEGDGGVRLLFKEFPVLGPGSEFAARAALASMKQDRYVDFHNAMMQSGQRLAEPQVLAIAEKIGLDVERLKQDMQDPELQASIDRNLELARALAINGTPSFVIGDEIVRGATSLDNLKRLISEARNAQQ